MQQFNIRQNSTLPYLEMELINVDKKIDQENLK